MFGKRNKIDTGKIDALAHTLAGVSFFGGFTHEQLVRVAQLAEEVEADRGAVLIDQGRVGQECYVILDGEVDVYMAGEHVNTVGVGNMVGEMALVEHRPRNATVVAATPLSLVAFDNKGFRTLLAEMPEVNRRVIETLAARLQMNAGLTPGGAAVAGADTADAGGDAEDATELDSAAETIDGDGDGDGDGDDD